jgi:hypothetical protein
MCLDRTLGTCSALGPQWVGYGQSRFPKPATGLQGLTGRFGEARGAEIDPIATFGSVVQFFQIADDQALGTRLPSN